MHVVEVEIAEDGKPEKDVTWEAPMLVSYSADLGKLHLRQLSSVTRSLKGSKIVRSTRTPDVPTGNWLTRV